MKYIDFYGIEFLKSIILTLEKKILHKIIESIL